MLKLKNLISTIFIFLSLVYFILIFLYYYIFYLADIDNFIQLCVYYIIPLIFSLLSLFFLFTRTSAKINYLTFIIPLFIFFLFINLYLNFQLDGKINERVLIAKNKGIDFDTRSKSEIIKDFKKKGTEAYPAIYSSINYSYNFFAKNKQLHPLGGISNVTTVNCNETGEYQIYDSDKYGFNNLNKVYDYKKLQVGIIGDSYLQGSCVKRENTIGSFISEKYPKTLVIASSGNGSLSNLASLVEYLSDKEPEVVLWFFTAGNDLIEQKDERKNFKILNKYLEEKDFKQNLKLYQKEIDKQLITISKIENPDTLKTKVREIVLFFAFEKLLNELTAIIFKIVKKYSPDVSNEIIQLNPQYEREYLIKVLLKAKEIVESWSGNFITVYIPHQEEMFLDDISDFLISNEIFNNLMKKNNINTIDIVSILINEKNPKDLYSLNLPISKHQSSHFDEDGYKKISEIILKEISNNYIN